MSFFFLLIDCFKLSHVFVSSSIYIFSDYYFIIKIVTIYIKINKILFYCHIVHILLLFLKIRICDFKFFF